MDTSGYLQIAHNLLDNQSHYQQLDRDPTDPIMRIIKVTVQEAVPEGSIAESTGKFLVNLHPRTPLCLCHPKIHKHGSPPLGHRIVSSSSSHL